MRRRELLAGAVAAAGAGCLGGGSGSAGTSRPGKRPATPVPPGTSLGYTYTRPSGNRFVEGQGALPGVDPVDVALEGTPRWLAAAPDGAGRSVWAAVHGDGRVEAVRIPGADGPYERVDIAPDSLPAGTPPLLAVGDTTTALVAPPAGGSTLSHPVPAGGNLVYVESDGDVVVQTGTDRERFPVDALPDARPAVVGGRAFVLSGATDRYTHGVLGDETEATSVTVLDAAEPAVETTISVPEGAVIEGLAPILADAWGDPAVLVTVSDAEAGARIVAYAPDGERVAASEAIGRGYRWRHQICVAPVGPGGETELVDVRTPHIGGTVEFFARREGRLAVVGRERGYSSHAIGSRNLDGALAGDFDGDGAMEVLVPTDDGRRLGGVRRTEGGAETAYRVAVGGAATTNLAGAPRGDRLAVGVGRAGSLRVW